MHKIKCSPYSTIFWNEFKIAPDSRAYNIVADQTIHGNLDIPHLKMAIDNLIADHILFDSHLLEEAGSLYWIKNRHPGTLQHFYGLDQQQQFIEHFFDLECGPLYKFGLFEKQPEQCELIIVLHHLIVDGSSGDYFLKSIETRYNRSTPLKSLSAEDISIIGAKIERDCEELRTEGAEAFWKQRRGDFSRANTLPELTRPEHTDRKGGAIRFSLNKAEIKTWRAEQPLRHIVPFHLLIGAWGALLGRYGNTDNAQISFPVSIAAGRDFSMGAHVNIAVLPMCDIQKSSFRQLYQKNLQFFRGACSPSGARYIELPTHQIAQACGIESFDAAFAQTDLRDSTLHLVDCRTHANQRYLDDMGGASILLEYHEYEDRFDFRLRYLCDVFSRQQIETWSRHYCRFLRHLIMHPDTPVGDFPLLDETEQCNLRALNPAETSYPHRACIQQLVQGIAELRESSVALRMGPDLMSYGRLNARANQLARELRIQFKKRHGYELHKNTPIGVFLERSFDLIVAMLAVLKAGAAWVPLSTAYPESRISFMIEDSGAPLIITSDQWHQKLENIIAKSRHSPDLVNVSNELSHPSHNLDLINDPDDLAYVMYTSGTTGRPKGVEIPHRGVVSLVRDSNFVEITNRDTFLFLSNPCFDAATFEVWGALCNGATLILPPPTQSLMAADIAGLLEQHEVSILWLTRALFDSLYRQQPDMFASLSVLLVGGEALSSDIMLELLASPNRPRQILNGYGPTESTTFTTTFDLDTRRWSGGVPIGRPVNTRQIYILSIAGQIQPVGVAGEIHIAGAGLARGYLNRPELTAQSFIANPFSSAEDRIRGYTTLYRTGDFGRWLPDGNIEYLGRVDSQVKIRGHRVELREIENSINTLESVKQSVVIDLEHAGHKVLAAYVVAEAGYQPQREDLLASLEGFLPAYMLPSTISLIDAIPLTSNGKLDRTALPEPEWSDLHRYHAPETALQTTLCLLWQEVLGLDRIGIHDHFFRLGGDSIVCISLVSRMRRSGYCLQVKDVFAAPTVAQLAAWLESHAVEPVPDGEQGILTGRFELLPVQAWFFSQKLPQPSYFNQAFRLTLPDSVTVEQLNAVLSALAQRHDILRCRFVDTPEGPRQEYLSDCATTFAGIERLNLARMSEAQCHERLTALQCGFDIFRGPLWRAAYIERAGNGFGELWIAAHHLIIDAVSWRILLNDIRALCLGESLGKKGSSYRQWVAAIENYAAQRVSQISWWQDQIANQPDYRLRDDLMDGYHQTSIQLDAAQTGRMLKETAGAFHTEINDLLLSALCIALQRWHGDPESWITLEGHGRQEIDPGLNVQNTVGWFTCLYPVKLTMKETVIGTLRHIKESLRAVPDKGIGFGALKYARGGNPVENGLAAYELPLISFNYLGQFISSELPSHWQLAIENCGATVAPLNADNNVIQIAGGVFQQRLHLRLTSRLRHDVAQKLASDFSKVLEEIIDLCAKRSALGHSLFSPADFPLAGVTMSELDRLQKAHAIEDIYRATHFQRELMYFNRVDSDFQIDQTVHEINGVLEPELFGEAWAHMVAQHDILRAGFSDSATPGEPNVFVCKKIALPIQIVDWSALDEEAKRKALHQAVLQQRNQSFDFENPPLFRLFIARVEAERHLLIHTFNHILFDGWSLGTMMKEVSTAYVALQKSIPPATRVRSFAPFSAFLQRDFDSRRARTFWEPYLQGAKLNQRLPQDTAEIIDTRRDLRMRCVESALTPNQNTALYEFGKLHGYTANQLTQLAWMRVLSDELDEDDICIGTTMSERPATIDDAEHLVGLFVATPVLRLTAIRKRNVPDLLEDVSRTQMDRQQFAFHELNEYDQNWVPVSPFGSLFVFENMPEASLDSSLPFRIRLLDVVSGSNHQTVLCLFPHKNGLQLRLFYDAREVAEETAVRLITRFTAVLDSMTATSVGEKQ